MSKLFPDAQEAYYLDPEKLPIAPRKYSIFEKLYVYSEIRFYAKRGLKATCFYNLSLEMQAELQNKGYTVLTERQWYENNSLLSFDVPFNYVVSWKKM